MTNIDNSYTILIADDDEINRVILKHMLKCVNVEIISVPDGEEAMVFLNDSPDRKVILLLDVNMPNMDGNDVIERVNMDSALKSRIRIIVITANLLLPNLKIGMEDNVLGCLEKPVNKEALINLIKVGAKQIN
jgi:CheY-like chemotaxis protein